MAVMEGASEAEARMAGLLRSWAAIAPAAGRRYGSIPELVLDMGMWCRPAPFPRKLRRLRGREQACYANAARLAARAEGLRYVEGFADPGLGGQMSIEHAWCVTPDGRVVDPTWDEDPPAVAFLGVPFSLDYRARILHTRPKRFGSIRMLDHHANPSLLVDGLPADALAIPRLVS